MSETNEPTLEEKKELLSKAGFRSGGFRKEEEPAPPAPNPAAEEMSADAETANEVAQELDLNLPGAPAPESEETKSPEEEESEARAAAPEEEGEIRIGTRTFKSQKEAYAYAQELEARRIADDAFRQGIEAARGSQGSNTENKTVTPEETEEIPDYYYSDPARYQREMREKIKREAIDAVKREQQLAETSRQTMSQFYKDYPDLSGDEDVVDMFIKRDWENIKGLETKVGLKLVAERARNWLEEKVKKRLPAKELPRVKQAASSGTTQTVTTKKTDGPALNFIKQQQNLKTPQGRAAARKRLGL